MTKRPLRVIEKHRPLVFILVSPVILVLRLHYLVGDDGQQSALKSLQGAQAHSWLGGLR